MDIRVGVNGLGRIGRLLVRALEDAPDCGLRLVAVNSPGPAGMSAHLLAYDSVHGRWSKKAGAEGEALVVEGRKIAYSSARAPEDIEWARHAVDLVFECSGKFKTGDSLSGHLRAGARKVLLSAPGSDVDATIVYGVNHEMLKADDRLISCASCTTNCLAPLLDVIDRHWRLDLALMTTIHAYTGDQPLLDRRHSDPYRARAAGLSLIPTTTGAARAIGDVLPRLQGKIKGLAVRAPSANVSMVDLSFCSEKPLSRDELASVFHQEAKERLRGVLAVEDAPLVSVDFNHDPHSAIVASDLIEVLDSRLGRIIAWYDNEWGFVQRMLDVGACMARARAS